MPYAVTLRLDAAMAAPVEAMWRALAAAGLHDDSLSLGYPPHLTLTILPDGADASRLAATVADCAVAWTAIDLNPAGLGLFVTPEPVLYLAPVPTAALIGRHHDLAAALGDNPADPHYRRGAWVPHVTLAKGGPARDPGWTGRALDCLRPLCADLRPGRADRLDLVHFRPVTVLHSHPLPDGVAPRAPSV